MPSEEDIPKEYHELVLEREKGLTFNHINQTLGRLGELGTWPDSRVKTVPIMDFDNMARSTLVPLRKGGAWDIATQQEVTPEAYREAYMLSRIGSVDYNPASLSAEGHAMPKLLKDHYPSILLDYIGWLFVHRAGKAIAHIKHPLSSIGKTLIFDALGWATGLVSVHAMTEITGRSQFSTYEADLGRGLIVAIDEAEKSDKALRFGYLNEITAAKVKVNEKYGEQYRTFRSATAVFVGGDWARVNTDDQGMDTRTPFALDTPWGNAQHDTAAAFDDDPIGRIPTATYRHIEACATCQMAVFTDVMNRAHRFYKMMKSEGLNAVLEHFQAHPQVAASLQRMREERPSDIGAWLGTQITKDPKGYLVSIHLQNSLRAALSSLKTSMPSNQDLSRIMQTRFQATNETQRIEGR